MDGSLSRLANSTVTLLACGLVLSGCTASGGQTSSPTRPAIRPVTVKVAFLADGSVENSYGIVTPAMQGMKLAFSLAAQTPSLPVHAEVEWFDTQGDVDRSLEEATDIAGDPSYVAVVVGPFWEEPPEVTAVLREAGLPTFSLSSLGPPLGSQGGWWRIISARDALSRALISHTLSAKDGSPGVCVVGDGTPFSEGLGSELIPSLGDTVLLRATLSPEESAYPVELQVATARCGTVLWTGFSSGAVALRSALSEKGLDEVRMVLSDAAKDETFLAGAGPAGQGTVAGCSCLDLSTSTDSEAQRFVHDFQASTGAPPGIYAVEGFDVGGMLLRAFRGGLSTRELLMQVYAEGPGPYDGLAGSYAFASDGNLDPVSGGVHLFRDQGLTWVPLEAAGSSQRLPLRTPGVLTVGSCRKGAPFAYREHGSLTGFDVEIAAEIARRLGLTMDWGFVKCGSASDALARGRIDVLMTSQRALDPQTPASRIYLSRRVAVTMRARDASAVDPLGRLGRGDVVGVVQAGSSARWAKRYLGGADGPVLRSFSDAAGVYDLLASGKLDAVVDVEPGAWQMIENRPSLRVITSQDAGDHDVMIARGPDTVLLGAVDSTLGDLIRSNDYGRFFAKYFPGAALPAETGS